MILTLFAIKLLVTIIRFSRLGRGTSLPGIIIEKYYPQLLEKLGSQFKKVIFITGTNGKTTTQHLISYLLKREDEDVCSNKSGANLIRGIATSIILDTTFTGKLKSDIGVFEVEEASMPILTKYLKPSHIVVTSLYRDQLDAYGELVKTRNYILNAVKSCPKSKLFLNKNDENVSSIASECNNDTTLFSIRDKIREKIFFERSYFKYKNRKGLKRVYTRNVKIKSDLSTEFNVYGLNENIKDLQFNALGIHNIYNALAALSVIDSIYKISSSEIKSTMSNFLPVFGRGEIVKVNNKNIRLLLVKNPASLTANLTMLQNRLSLKLLIILNDKIADGTDVSWIWDAKFELLGNADISWITISGKRAYDMALRLKYADVRCINIEIEPNISKALDLSISKLREGDTLFVLPTYTAMLDIRKDISNIVKIKNIWN